jgi:outer membrane protein OmpA-like peptidoglycan-associated protein
MQCKPNALRLFGGRAGLSMLAALLVIDLAPHVARAEGAAQLGRISTNGNSGLMAGAVLFVDVLNDEDTLNIVARGQGSVDVTVAAVNSDGSVGTVSLYTLTPGAGLLSGPTLPETLPNGQNVPLRVAVEAGRYRVMFGEAVEPFDLTVTTGSVSYSTIDVPPNGGRLSSKDWRFFGGLPNSNGNETPMNADFYVRASVGAQYEYVWQLAFDGLLGGQMCLTANDLGLPGPFARSSQPYSALAGLEGFDANDRFSFCEELSKYDIYVNPPNNRKPEPPEPTLSSFELGACGAMIEGSGGVFSFETDLEGTYLLVVDVNRDGVFDVKQGDLGLGGLAQAGSNVVAWDGRDANGDVVVANDAYAARLFLRLGEFHFTGNDIEALDPGIRVYRWSEDGVAISTPLHWDDEALQANNFNGALIAPTPVWSTPTGVLAPHGWRGAQLNATSYSGPGENAFIDSWVFGAELTRDVAFSVLLSDDDLDGDGLINGRECVIGSRVDEVDTDGDGVWDGQEELSSNLNDPPTDSDNDGIPDALDDDDDNDGIPTRLENPDPNNDGDTSDAQDTDGDGKPDYLDDDDDGDGILTRDELGDDNDNGIPDYLEGPEEPILDSDGDGILDDVECPVSGECPDTDGDGVPDYLDDDDDGDGIPTIDEDLDGDGDPTNDDSDGDGKPDYLDDDDDGDGIPTQTEVADGAEFGDDIDKDGLPNWLDTDSDGDGVADGTEAMGGGDANANGIPDYLEPEFWAGDTDVDGVLDVVECPVRTACNDTDGDGIPDYLDEDDDGDGVPTAVEVPAGNLIDTDGDGVPDYLDEDDDGDGVFTRFEHPDPNGDGNVADARDTDDDGVPDYLDDDDDGDGIPTRQEGADPNGDGNPEDAIDSDGDGIPDYLDAETNRDGDSDGDGVLDEDECPIPDNCPDTDNDGVPDFEDPDDDGDGIPTALEDLDGDGDPTNDDSDGDGIPNYLDEDDDNDGVLTKFEDVDGDGDPTNDDTDGDGIPNYLDADDDGDSIPTSREMPDPNGDGNPEDARDTDGDGIPDYLDADDDGDGIPTREEVGNPDKPRDSNDDGTPDYLDASDDEGETPEQPEQLPVIAELRGGGLTCSLPRGAGDSNSTGVMWSALGLGAALLLRRRRRTTVSVALVASVWVCFQVSDALAQKTAPGFAINRYNPSEPGSDWFAGESLDLRGHGRTAVGLVFDWAHKPLVSSDTLGNEVASVVRHQFYGHLGLSVNLWDRLRLAANVPVLFDQTGTPVLYGGERYETRNGAEVGDLRLGIDVRVLGECGGPATLAVGSQLTLPTGDRYAYTGDDYLRVLPRATVAGDISAIAYSFQAALDYRGLRQDYAGIPFGTEVRFVGALGVRLKDRAWLIGPEVWGSTVISDSGDGFLAEESTPVEGVLGAHYLGRVWRFGIGAGPGLTRGLGTPAWRALASIEWFPSVDEGQARPARGVDTDGDGIPDGEDACVSEPGLPNGDRTKHGCPAVQDSDGDGITDDEDACISLRGVPSANKQAHGCPPDRDGDGVWDDEDACVEQPGPQHDDAQLNGCPLSLDSDGDGIVDAEDACRHKAGPVSADPHTNGCPRVEVDGERLVILDRIEFDVGKATIRPETRAILEAVRQVIVENPRIEKLRIEGHTDNRGTRQLNLMLSRQRAAAVVQWLVDHGIARSRLSSRGVGPDSPIDTNETDLGRQNNRRVEFHIVEMSQP